MQDNLENFYYTKFEFEYIISEWCPTKPLIEEFPKLSQHKNIVDLVIDNSVSRKESLRDDVFYEYFAKNAGVRHAKYDNILLINADILLGYDLIRKIQDLLKEGLSDKHYYRPGYRHDYLPGKGVQNSQRLWEPHNPDGHLAAGYSGDFLLLRKDMFVDKGCGYDETDSGHRSNFQTGMDGEILSNMYHKGINPFMIDASYYHLHHPKNRSYTGSNYRENIQYQNKPDWGFVNYRKEKVSDQLYRITDE